MFLEVKGSMGKTLINFDHIHEVSNCEGKAVIHFNDDREGSSVSVVMETSYEDIKEMLFDEQRKAKG